MKKIEVCKDSKIHGKGVCILEECKKGEKIQYLKGKIVKKKITNKKESLSRDIANWYGITKGIHLDPEDTIFRYLNHSCNPNAAIIGKKTLVALKNLIPGEELTIDYSLSEGDPLWEMNCSCGEKECRKIIKSINFLPKKVFNRHMPNIPRYFQKLYFRTNKMI